jgi:hypothetical protein
VSGGEFAEEGPDASVDVGDDAADGVLVLTFGVVEWPVLVAGAEVDRT